MKSKILVNLLVLSALFIYPYHLSSFANDHNKQAQAEQCYQQALLHYERGETKLAIQQLQAALKLNKKFAQAYNRLALIYMAEGTVHGRFRATIELDKALKLEPKNIEFLFNEAILNIKKDFKFIAEKNFKNIIKLDPQNYLAYYHIASIKEEEMLHYQDMISIENGSDVIISMDSFARELKEQVADYYKKAIAVNPGFSDAYYHLALIYFEFDDFDEMIQLLESAIKVTPQDKNCHLFLGFAYHNTGKFHNAAQEYQLAKQLMSPAERELLESIATILTPGQEEKYESIPPLEQQFFKQAFWTSRDPFYLSEINERELEHFSRVAYANLRFSKPEKIEGWQTDRGKVLIRYGLPKSKYRTRPYIGALIDGRNPLHHSKEVWIYPAFHFVFEDRYLADNYTFAWGDRPENDYQDIYERMIKKFPEYYDFFPDSQFFDVPYDLVAFQGQNRKTELEFCFSIPTDHLSPGFPDPDRFSLTQGIFFFDQYWNPVVRKTKELSFQTKDVAAYNLQPYYSHHELIEIKPGHYYFAFEFEDKKSGQRSRIHRNVQIDTFYQGQFQLSDVLWARDLQPPNLNVPPARSDFQFKPNPLKTFSKGEPMVIYYEIYNLGQDVAGETHYKIEYQIAKDLQSLSTIKKILTQVGLRKKGGEVTSSYEYLGTSATELQYQKIMLDPNMTGKIILTLKATDLITGKAAHRQESFTVIEKR